MAGDWMPVRLDLHDSPRVLSIADATGLEPDTVVGKVLRVWSWAQRHTHDGHAFVTLLSRSERDTNARNARALARIDEIAGHDGFGRAMIDVGWLLIKDGGLELPEWDVWNAKSAKRRLLASRRKKLQRCDTENGCHASVAKMSRAQRDKNATTGEESIYMNPPLPPFSKGGNSLHTKLTRRGRKAAEQAEADAAATARLIADGVLRPDGRPATDEQEGTS